MTREIRERIIRLAKQVVALDGGGAEGDVYDMLEETFGKDNETPKIVVHVTNNGILVDVSEMPRVYMEDIADWVRSQRSKRKNIRERWTVSHPSEIGTFTVRLHDSILKDKISLYVDVIKNAIQNFVDQHEMNVNVEG